MSRPPAAPARTEEMAVINRKYRRGFPMVADLDTQRFQSAVHKPTHGAKR